MRDKEKVVAGVASIAPKELSFPLQVGASFTKKIKVQNNKADTALAFKFQCNAPSRYAVTPASGVIAPSSEQSVAVRLKALQHTNFEKSDKFLIRIIQVDSETLEFPNDKWASVPKSTVTKYLVKVLFNSTLEADRNLGSSVVKLQSMSESKKQIGGSEKLWTPHATNIVENHKVSRFSTPLASSMKISSHSQAQQAAAGLKRIWSERASRKRDDDDSPQAASRYDHAVRTVENVAAVVHHDKGDINDSNEARVIELLIKDGSRKEEHKLSKEELHELIGYKNAVADSQWQTWVTKAHKHRNDGIELSQDENRGYEPYEVQQVNMDMTRQAQSVKKLQRSRATKLRKFPHSVKADRKVIAASRRNTYTRHHNAPRNTKYPQKNQSLEVKSADDNRRPWEGNTSMHNPGSTHSSVLRKVLTRRRETQTGMSTAKKASFVRNYMKKNGDNRRHSLRKKEVKFGYGIVPHTKGSRVHDHLKMSKSLSLPKKTSIRSRENASNFSNKEAIDKTGALTDTEKALLEKVINYEARLDAVEAERASMMKKIDEIAQKGNANAGDSATKITSNKLNQENSHSLSLADLSSLNPHDLKRPTQPKVDNTVDDGDIEAFSRDFDTPLGVVIGSHGIIKSVNVNSAASDKGLKVGDKIISVGGESISENISPQALSAMILQNRESTGFARLHLLRNKSAEKLQKNMVLKESSLGDKNVAKKLTEAKRRIVLLETEVDLLKNSDNTWKHKEKLKDKLKLYELENKDLKSKCKALERDTMYLAGQLRGYSGASHLSTGQINTQVAQLRECLDDTAEAVKTIFEQVSRDLTIFTRHIVAYATRKTANAIPMSSPIETIATGKFRELSITGLSRSTSDGKQPGNSILDVICAPRTSSNKNAHDESEDSILRVEDQNTVTLNFGATPKNLNSRMPSSQTVLAK